MENVLIIFLGGIVVLIVLGLSFCLAIAIFTGALILFADASQQGFVGVAVYGACWVFLFPFMIIVCLIFGVLTMKN
ncbi:MAG: hypothetical protein ACI9MF_001133 [Gammaproteobacteria bacterium]|jgi:hypothetical protein